MVDCNHRIYIYIPGSSRCVKIVPFHPKNMPKGRNFTYLEDPGIYIYLCHHHECVLFNSFIIMSHCDCASSSLCQHILKSSCICSPFLSQSNCSQRCFLSSWRMIDLTSTAALGALESVFFSRPNHSGFKEQIMFKRSSKHSVLVSSAESTWISNHFILLMDKILHHQGWWLSLYL